MLHIVNRTGLGRDTKVFDSKGNDLTAQLGPVRIDLSINAESGLIAKLHCETTIDLEAKVMKLLDPGSAEEIAFIEFRDKPDGSENDIA